MQESYDVFLRNSMATQIYARRQSCKQHRGWAIAVATAIHIARRRRGGASSGHTAVIAPAFLRRQATRRGTKGQVSTCQWSVLAEQSQGLGR